MTFFEYSRIYYKKGEIVTDKNFKLALSILGTFFIGLFFGIFISMYLFAFATHHTSYKQNNTRGQINYVGERATTNYKTTQTPKVQTLPYRDEGYELKVLPYNGESYNVTPLHVGN